NPDLVFGKVDTEAQPELAAAFGIQSIPTLMIVRDQVAVFAQPGALPEAALTDVIGQARKLDMAEVRKAVAEQPAQSGEGQAPGPGGAHRRGTRPCGPPRRPARAPGARPRKGRVTTARPTALAAPAPRPLPGRAREGGRTGAAVGPQGATS